MDESDEPPTRWLLERDGVLLATLVQDDQDFPWTYCTLVPEDGFAFIADRFGAGAVSSEELPGVTLRAEGGVTARWFALAVDDGGARFQSRM